MSAYVEAPAHDEVVRWFFAWVDDGSVPFDPVAHAVEDELVYNVEISEQQGNCAVAMLDIHNPRAGLYGQGRKQWMWISTLVRRAGVLAVEPQLFGAIDAWPFAGDGDAITIKVVAQPDDWEERQDDAFEPIRVQPFYDDALIGSRDPLTEVEVNLEGRPALVHTDRVTHAVEVVSVIDAPTVFNIGNRWFAGTFKPTLDDRPLDGVRVVLTAKWRQPIRTSVVISAGGFGGYTLTPKSVESSWPKDGATLGSFTVTQSLIATVPSVWSNGYLTNHKLTAAGGLGATGTPAGAAVQRTFPQRFEYYGSIVAWLEYEIQRTETATIDVMWNGQKTNRLRRAANIQTIPLNLAMETASGVKRWKPGPGRFYRENDIRVVDSLGYRCLADHEASDDFISDLNHVDPETSIADPLWVRYQITSDLRSGNTYFGTARGKVSSDHAILVGHAALAQSRACFGSSVEIPVELGLQLRCSMMAQLTSVPLGGDGSLIGKVASYTITANADTQTASVQLKSVPGSGIDPTGGEEYDTSPRIEVESWGQLASYDIFSFYTGKTWGSRPAWWPQGRAWPPRADEDTMGLYVAQRTLQRVYPDTYGPGGQGPFGEPGGYKSGSRILQNVDVGDGDGEGGGTPVYRDVWIATVGFSYGGEYGPAHALASNPYEGVTFPTQKPSWWPKWPSFTGLTGDVVAWPPTEQDDIFQYHIVPPKFDEMDGTGGNRDEVEEMFYSPEEEEFARSSAPAARSMAIAATSEDDIGPHYILEASDAGWDTMQVPIVNFPVYPPASPFSLYKVVVTNPGSLQEAMLQGQQNLAGFDPQAIIDANPTTIAVETKDQSNASSWVDIGVVVKWNGPKHVDLSAEPQA